MSLNTASQGWDHEQKKYKIEFETHESSPAGRLHWAVQAKTARKWKDLVRASVNHSFKQTVAGLNVPTFQKWFKEALKM
jgi:hypothetical protein